MRIDEHDLSPGRDPDPIASAMYAQLRDMAHRLVAGERGPIPVDATEIVHECYLRLAHVDELEGMDRTEFLALAATLIRHVLVDLARRRRAAKRGGEWSRMTLSGLSAPEANPVDLVELDEALRKLRRVDERQHRIVELRFFAGLSGEEIATLMAISRRTVVKEWTMARAWLRRSLAEDD